jgi:signal transduction histidine kinase
MRFEQRPPVFWIGTIVAILLLVLIAFAGVTAVTTRDKTIADETDNLVRLSLMLAEHAQRLIFSADLIASSLEEGIARSGVRTPAQFRRHVANRQMHALLQKQMIVTSEVDALSLIDGEGNLVNSARSWPPPPVNVSDRDYFIALRKSPLTTYTISAPQKNRVNQQESIFLAHRVSAPDGTFLGVVLVTISTRRFEKLYTAVLPNDGASISLYRQDGILLTRQPQSGDALEQSPEIQSFFHETLSRAEYGTMRAASGGTHNAPRFIAVRAVRGYPLLISVTSLESVALAAWWKLAGLIFAFSAAAVVLVVLLGLALVRVSKMQGRLVETAQQLARVNDELTASNQDLESFSYSVAHDLRAPLRRIAGFSSIVLGENRDRLGEKSAQFLDRIGAGVTQMGLLVDDLLELSQIARSPMNRRNFDISELAQSVTDTLAEAHPEHRVETFVKQGMRANGDPRLIRIVLENLLGNAWKFSARTNEVRIEAGAEERDGETIYFVRDNGAGFDMQYSGKLFKPFQRLHHADEFEGTGIGLSIVHRIITRHGGKIWAESAVGKGTVFWFTLGKDLPPRKS